MEKIIKNIKFFQLISAVNIQMNEVEYFSIYHDKIFFDYIAKTKDSFINFCLINENNSARYRVFIQLNDWLQRNAYPNFIMPEIKIIKLGEEQWFFEKMPYYEKLFSLSIDDYVLINESISCFNKHINSFIPTIDIKLQHDYNRILYNYCPDFLKEKFLESKNIVLEYGDIPTLFDCCRIKKCNQSFKFSGYQSFLFYDKIATKAIIFILSFLFDSVEEKHQKINLLPVEVKNFLPMIIEILLDRFNHKTKEYFNYSEDNIKNLMEYKSLLC